jgi:hypothetical protein
LGRKPKELCELESEGWSFPPDNPRLTDKGRFEPVLAHLKTREFYLVTVLFVKWGKPSPLIKSIQKSLVGHSVATPEGLHSGTGIVPMSTKSTSGVAMAVGLSVVCLQPWAIE